MPSEASADCFRYKVRMAMEILGSYGALAARSGVSEAELVAYLTDYTHELSDPDRDLVEAALPGIPGRLVEMRVKDVLLGYYQQKPDWDAEDLADIVEPPGAVSFVWHWCAPYATGNVRSGQVRKVGIDDPEEVAYDLVGDSLELLLELIWYV